MRICNMDMYYGCNLDNSLGKPKVDHFGWRRNFVAPQCLVNSYQSFFYWFCLVLLRGDLNDSRIKLSNDYHGSTLPVCTVKEPWQLMNRLPLLKGSSLGILGA